MTKTMHSYRNYVFTLEADPDPPAFIVDFPDIPRIITSGTTLDEASHNACEALDLYLEAVAANGKPRPESRHRLVMASS